MSGHSKWSTIKRQKEATDQQRGKIFTKLARAISIAVKEGGGGDPAMNFQLRLVIEKAKQSNMPKANIERAINSASSSGGGAGWEEITYEGYGPAGSAIMVEVVTDNRNRALYEIKQIFDRNGGALGQAGSVNYMFDKVGQILITKPNQNSENLILSIMEITGVIDVEESLDGIIITTEPNKLKQVQDELKSRSIEYSEADQIYQPKITKKLSPEETDKIAGFLTKLEDSDEVQKVFCDVAL